MITIQKRILIIFFSISTIFSPLYLIGQINSSSSIGNSRSASCGELKLIERIEFEKERLRSEKISATNKRIPSKRRVEMNETREVVLANRTPSEHHNHAAVTSSVVHLLIRLLPPVYPSPAHHFPLLQTLREIW